MHPIGTTLEKRINGHWCPGAIKLGPFQFDDEVEIIARWDVLFDDGDREFLYTDELQQCRIICRPPYRNDSMPHVDDPPYSLPMDDAPLSEQPEILFPNKDEDLPPHLCEPRPYRAPNPDQIARDFSGQFLWMETRLYPESFHPIK